MPVGNTGLLSVAVGQRGEEEQKHSQYHSVHASGHTQTRVQRKRFFFRQSRA